MEWSFILVSMSLLLFRVGSKNVYKTIKHSNSSIEDVDSWIIALLNDILPIATSIEKSTVARVNLIYLLQGLSFLKKKEISSAVRSNFNVSRSGTLDFNTSEGKKIVEQC